MIRHPFRMMGFAVCTLALALPIGAATNRATKAPSKAAPITKATPASKALRSSWPPETISGKILKVDPTLRLVILQAEGGIPFDMRVTRNTKIEAGNQKLGLDQVTAETQKKATVRFTPERSGDIARSIQIGG